MKGVAVCLLISLMLVLLAIKDTESKKMNLEELKKSIKNLRKPCSKKNDTPKELLDGQHNGEFPKDEKLMCYMKCVLTQTKAMRGDEIMWDFFVKNARVMILDEYFPRITHLVETCRKEVTATDGCEAAWQFSICTYATDSEVIFNYDYAGNNNLALYNTVNNSLMADSQDHRRTKRNFQSQTPRHRHLRHLRRRRSNRKVAVCRHNRNKPQCRRV